MYQLRSSEFASLQNKSWLTPCKIPAPHGQRFQRCAVGTHFISMSILCEGGPILIDVLSYRNRFLQDCTKHNFIFKKMQHFLNDTLLPDYHQGSVFRKKNT